MQPAERGSKVAPEPAEKTSMTEPKRTKEAPPPTDGLSAEALASATLQLELEALRARAEAAEKARDENLNQALRARADFENYQKRFQRDLTEERRYAQAPLARDLLPALDNLNRAMAAAEQAGEKGPLVKGVALVQSQLLDILRRHGITPIEALGQPFDHNRHEVVMQQKTADHPPMTVIQVLEQGYMIHERVLRPARVVVATPPEPAQ
jgi:molecular chaperone GrpE